VLTTIAAEEGPACVVAGEAGDLLTILRGAEQVSLRVDAARRLAIMRHHTATHLLHAALRQVLGSHVEQAGSVVDPGRLRFDFRHAAPLSQDEIRRIEAIVNDRGLANRPVRVLDDVPLAEAKQRGAMALFGEKYGERVRMIEIPMDTPLDTGQPEGAAQGAAHPDTTAAAGTEPIYSLELCGGTHCSRTGDVGVFRITSESSIAAGVRRIEAVAGQPALQLVNEERRELAELGRLLRPDGGAFSEQVRSLQAECDALRKKMQKLQQRSAVASLEEALTRPVVLGDLKIVAARVEAQDRDGLMQLGDHARDKLGHGVVVLAAAWEGKATLIATVTPDLVQAKRLHAGALVKAIAARVGGNGGGRPNMAQAGLPEVDRIEPALDAVVAIVQEQDSGLDT
jgi:alanyl-tRNA synthetase